MAGFITGNMTRAPEKNCNDHWKSNIFQLLPLQPISQTYCDKIIKAARRELAGLYVCLGPFFI